MAYRKHKNDLLVDWALLGERGWIIEPFGAQLLDDTEWNHCHLDRTTLDIMGAGNGVWWARVLTDLAGAGVPGLGHLRTWQIAPMVQTASRGGPALVLDYRRRPHAP